MTDDNAPMSREKYDANAAALVDFMDSTIAPASETEPMLRAMAEKEISGTHPLIFALAVTGLHSLSDFEHVSGDPNLAREILFNLAPATSPEFKSHD